MATIITRKTKSGVKYRVRIRRKGVSKSKTFKSKSDAEDWAEKMEDAINNKRDLWREHKKDSFAVSSYWPSGYFEDFSWQR